MPLHYSPSFPVAFLAPLPRPLLRPRRLTHTHASRVAIVRCPVRASSEPDNNSSPPTPRIAQASTATRAKPPPRSRARAPGPYRPDKRYPPGKLPLSLELDFVLNHPVTDAVIGALVVLNCLVFALQTIDVGPALSRAFVNYENNISIFFLIEYFARWYGKGLSPRFLLSRGMLIDFCAVAPIGFAVTNQSEALFVRILRLSRILRLQRVVMDTDGGKEIMESMSSIQVRLASIGLSFFSLLYVSAGLFYQVEKDVNPGITNFFDALYFSTITLFTVGFGDVTPLTSLGRTITVLTVLTGAVLVPFQLAEIESVRRLTEDSDGKRGAGPRGEIQMSVRGAGKKRRDVYLAENDASIECKRCHLIGHQADARFCRNCGAFIGKRLFD